MTTSSNATSSNATSSNAAAPDADTSSAVGRAARRGPGRALKVLGALGVCAALGVAPALAAWSTTGTGTASPVARSLVAPAAPTVPAASATASSLVVSGTLPAGQLAGTAYTLKRGATNVCTPMASSWNCTDTGLAASTTYSYTLVASLGAWTSTSPAGSGTTKCASASTFTVVASDTTPTAGTAFNLTLTAKNCSGVTDTTYTGAKAVTFSGPGASPSGKVPAYPATVTFANGVGVASVKLYDVETTTITATQGALTATSGNLTVSAGDPYTIIITNPSNKDGAVTIECNEGADVNEATHNCAQTSDGSSGGSRVWRGYLTLTDQWGNPRVNNIGAAIAMNVSVSGFGGGFTSTNIPQGAISSAQFTVGGFPNSSATRTITAVTTNVTPLITIKVTDAG